MKNFSAKKMYGMGISHLNAGSGDEISIKDLALLIKKIVGFDGDIRFNNDYPDGMPRKLLDVNRIADLGWRAKIPFNKGIYSTYESFLNEYDL